MIAYALKCDGKTLYSRDDGREMYMAFPLKDEVAAKANARIFDCYYGQVTDQNHDRYGWWLVAGKTMLCDNGVENILTP